MTDSPKWLKFLERHLAWIAVPNIALIFVTLQGLGFLMVMSSPEWIERLALIPQRVLQGEYWRLVTFLSLPSSLSPVWILISLVFIYSILNTIEAEWGAFKTTFYILVSIFLTVAVSFLLNFPVEQVSDIESTFFLAAATLFPEMEVQLYFLIPVKMKYLALLSGAFVVFHFFQLDWMGRIYLVAVYSNYLLFFGPALLYQLKQRLRKWDFKRKMNR